MTDEKLEYVCDRYRHLVCRPYSIANLHRMADELGIKRGWFDAGKRRRNSGEWLRFVRPHYDIPKRRIEEITAKCTVVTSKELREIIGGFAA